MSEKQNKKDIRNSLFHAFFEDDWDNRFKTEKRPTVSQKSIDELLDRVKKVENDIKKEKNSLISVFWIFASIVTFLSIEIQVLKSVCDYPIFLSITLITIGSLLLFNLVLHYLVTTSWKLDTKECIVWTISVLLIFLGSIIWLLWNEDACRDKKYIEYESKIEQRIDDIEKKYYKQTKQYIITKPSGH